MPKLLFFAPFRSASIDVLSNALSLHGLIETVSVSGTEHPPQDAVFPWDWCAVALWLYEDADAGKAFEQRSRLVSPDGTVHNEHVIEFANQPGIRTHRVRANTFGLPILPSGEHILELHWRNRGGSRWKLAGAYPIRIRFDLETSTPIVPSPPTCQN